MWHLVPWKKQVLIVAALAIAGAWAIDAVFGLLEGKHAPILKFVSLITMAITIGVAGAASLTWRYLWQRFPVVARKTFPDLNGKWEGTLATTWVDPATGN